MSAPTVSFDLDTVPERDRARVAAMIPDPRIAAGYVHRNIEGLYDFDLLDDAIVEMDNILLAGPTGSSKTTLFRAYAAARGLPFVVVECNAAMDPGIVIGRTVIGEDGTPYFVDGDMTLVLRYGGVVLIDEINMAHPRVTAAWHQLLSVIRAMSIPENGEVVKAGAGGIGARQPVLLAAAYNPGYQGVVRLNEALGNRFQCPLDWDYDRSVEEQLVKGPEGPATRLLDTATMIRDLAEIRTPVSTNMLQEFARHAKRRGMGLAERFFVGHFPAAERGPIARALEANRDAIAQELGLNR